MRRSKLALTIAVGGVLTTLAGGIALAAVAPLTLIDPGMVPGTTGTSQNDPPKDRLKAALDALVAKGTLTQAQADAVRAALTAKPTPNPAAPSRIPRVRPVAPSVRSFIGDLARATSEYLGIDRRTVFAQLRDGKSLAEVADGLSARGKSAAGLIAALVTAADGRIDRAVAEKRLTVDQAAALKVGVAAEVRSSVERKTIKPVRPIAPLKPTPSPKS